jgi:hypothetical protein
MFTKKGMVEFFEATTFPFNDNQKIKQQDNLWENKLSEEKL